MTRTVTAPLACSAYRQGRAPTYLTHLVEVEADGHVVRTFCRVRRDSVLPDTACYTAERPTCPTCATRWAKLNPGG